eukprot:5542801-Prymnesium_polylepis.1
MPNQCLPWQFIATIILVNLLVAQMADTYGRITEEGFLRWQFERAQLISEYKDTKKPFPPPLNVVYVALAKLGMLLFPPKDERIHTGFKYMPKEDLRQWQQKELAALKMCVIAREKRESETTDAKMSRLQDLLQKQEEGTRRRFEEADRKLDKQAVMLTQL